MGILNDLGVADSLPGIPKIEIAGFFSNTWVWVLVAVFIGIILIGVISWVLFLLTYNKKIVFFEIFLVWVIK